MVEGELEDLSDAQIEQTLQALGCSLLTREEGWEVVVPPSRSMDLQREVDLIEEVARLELVFDTLKRRLRECEAKQIRS